MFFMQFLRLYYKGLGDYLREVYLGVKGMLFFVVMVEYKQSLLVVEVERLFLDLVLFNDYMEDSCMEYIEDDFCFVY